MVNIFIQFVHCHACQYIYSSLPCCIWIETRGEVNWTMTMMWHIKNGKIHWSEFYLPWRWVKEFQPNVCDIQWKAIQFIALFLSLILNAKIFFFSISDSIIWLCHQWMLMLWRLWLDKKFPLLSLKAKIKNSNSSWGKFIHLNSQSFFV